MMDEDFNINDLQLDDTLSAMDWDNEDAVEMWPESLLDNDNIEQDDDFLDDENHSFCLN